MKYYISHFKIGELTYNFQFDLIKVFIVNLTTDKPYKIGWVGGLLVCSSNQSHFWDLILSLEGWLCHSSFFYPTIFFKYSISDTIFDSVILYLFHPRFVMRYMLQRSPYLTLGLPRTFMCFKTSYISLSCFRFIN